jgi:hypothetical protein
MQSSDLPDVRGRGHGQHGRAVAVGAGIEPAEDRLTICPVFQHTSPTLPSSDQRCSFRQHGRPPRASLHAVRPFSDCQRAQAHLRLRFSSRRQTTLQTRCQRVHISNRLRILNTPLAPIRRVETSTLNTPLAQTVSSCKAEPASQRPSAYGAGRLSRPNPEPKKIPK